MRRARRPKLRSHAGGSRRVNALRSLKTQTGTSDAPWRMASCGGGGVGRPARPPLPPPPPPSPTRLHEALAVREDERRLLRLAVRREDLLGAAGVDDDALACRGGIAEREGRLTVAREWPPTFCEDAVSNRGRRVHAAEPQRDLAASRQVECGRRGKSPQIEAGKELCRAREMMWMRALRRPHVKSRRPRTLKVRPVHCDSR